MYGADTKALFAKYFQKDKSHFSHYTVQVIYTMFDKLFSLVFVKNYPVSWQLMMDILFGHPLIGQLDTISQAEKAYFLTCLVLYFYTLTFTVALSANSHK